MGFDRGVQLYGYTGRQLRVNLTDGKSSVETVDAALRTTPGQPRLKPYYMA